MFATAIATAALTALAVVASVEGASALSTIALVLAIVAFTIQIFLFVVQSQAASEQRVRSEQIHTQTRALLAEVRTTAQATQAMVSQQFNQLLQAFVAGAAQTAQETKFDPVIFEQRLMSNIRNAAQPPTAGEPSSRPSAGSEARERTSDRPRPSATPAARRSAASVLRARRERPFRLKTFPMEPEGSRAAATLRKLAPEIRRRLWQLGEDEIKSADSGTYIGLDPEPSDDVLEREHLVTPARVNGSNGTETVTRLTDDGVAVARLLTALGDIPSWARDVVEIEDTSDDSQSDDDIPF